MSVSFFSGYLDVSVLPVPFPTLYIQDGMPAGGSCGRVAPLGYPRITACLTAPRGLSQPATPFIGPKRQGIHPLPLLT